MRIAQVVLTEAFAGTERYVATVSAGLAARGHEVTVIGGDERLMTAQIGGAAWLPGGTIRTGAKSLADAGRQHVVHAHLTNAEALAVLMKPRHRGHVVATRHLTTLRGQSKLGSLLRPVIERGLDRELAISRYVAETLGLPDAAVVLNFVPESPLRWQSGSRTFAVAQRLEVEKHTSVALDAWRVVAADLSDWRLVIAGDGADRSHLEAMAGGLPRVEFRGRLSNVGELWDAAGVLVATRPDEPFGLTVVEAMAAGVPVIAASGGGHLETAGIVSDHCLYTGANDLADSMRRMADDHVLRDQMSTDGRRVVKANFGIDRHMDRLLTIYESLR